MSTDSTGALLLDITTPLRVVSESNQREHWAAKAKRQKAHRAAAHLLILQARRALAWPDGRKRVLLTRIGARMLDDDNLAGAFKAVRDGIADGLEINDGSDAVQWRYAQEKSPGLKINAVRVQIWGIE